MSNTLKEITQEELAKWADGRRRVQACVDRAITLVESLDFKVPPAIAALAADPSTPYSESIVSGWANPNAVEEFTCGLIYSDRTSTARGLLLSVIAHTGHAYPYFVEKMMEKAKELLNLDGMEVE